MIGRFFIAVPSPREYRFPTHMEPHRQDNNPRARQHCSDSRPWQRRRPASSPRRAVDVSLTSSSLAFSCASSVLLFFFIPRVLRTFAAYPFLRVACLGEIRFPTFFSFLVSVLYIFFSIHVLSTICRRTCFRRCVWWDFFDALVYGTGAVLSWSLRRGRSRVVDT